jgi:hypothetical protein
VRKVLLVLLAPILQCQVRKVLLVLMAQWVLKVRKAKWVHRVRKELVVLLVGIR